MIEVGPEVTVPAALAPQTDQTAESPEKQAVVDAMAEDFLNAVGNTTPSDEAAVQKWKANQLASDDLYKLYFGYQAYNQKSAAAAFSAWQESQQ